MLFRYSESASRGQGALERSSVAALGASYGERGWKQRRQLVGVCTLGVGGVRGGDEADFECDDMRLLRGSRSV